MQVLLPIKSLSNAKGRLCELLDQSHRQGLFKAMTHDVLAVLTAQTEISSVILISDDPVAELLADKYGIELMTERALKVAGLNEAIQAAVLKLASRKINDVMIIHADIPLVNGPSLSELISRHHCLKGPKMSIIPDRHRIGSNCIICSTESKFIFQYGENSFQRHCDLATSLGFSVQVIEDPDIGCDIDYPYDLEHFLNRNTSNNSSRTKKYLSKHGITKNYIKTVCNRSTSQGQEYG